MAEETLHLALALRMAQAKADTFRRYVRNLQQQAKPARKHRGFTEVEVVRIRPEQVWWFEQNRIPYQLLD